MAGYNSTTDKEEEQTSIIEDFYTDQLMPLGEKFFEDDLTGSLTVSHGSRTVQELYLFSQVIFVFTSWIFPQPIFFLRN